MTTEERLELDARICEHVMGWKLVKNNGAAGGHYWTGHGGRFTEYRKGYEPAFSSDPTAASRVLDVLAGADVLWTIDNDEPGTAHVTLILPESADFFTVDGSASGKPSEAWPLALAKACTTDPVLSHMAAWRANREETKADV